VAVTRTGPASGAPPDQWQRVKAIFAEALELDPRLRERFVRDACRDESAIAEEVLSLLAADSDVTLLKNPILKARDPIPPPAPEAAVFTPRLEEQFAADYFRRSLPRVRGAIVLAIFLYSVFGLLDSRVAPEQTRFVWFIRFGLVCPPAVVLLIYSFTESFSRHWQVLVSLLMLHGAIGIIAMVASIPAPGSYLYSSGLLLVIFYYSTLFRVGFRHALAVSLVILVVYNVVVSFTTIPFVALLINDMMLVAADVIALSANVALERHSRSEFTQRLEIASRTLALETTNQELITANRELLRSREEILRTAERNDLLFAALTEALPGTVLEEKYRLDERIGAGGFGTVYRAFHLALQRNVAVKLLKPTGGDLQTDVAQFRREGIAACRLNHPNAVTVLDFGVAAGSVAYLVMELLEGHSLAQELEQCGPFTLERCGELVVPLCAVLAEAHRLGLVHRDLKPSNVFLHRHGETEVVKMIDFGLAKRIDDQPRNVHSMTLTMGLRGTPGYIAPERFATGECGWPSDIYSLGVMVHEMVTGGKPSETSLRAGNPHLPGAVLDAIDRALSAEPGHRPTAQEFGRAFADRPSPATT
jgi:hypothetical protein